VEKLKIELKPAKAGATSLEISWGNTHAVVPVKVG
jgi:hypothetical protein